MLNFSTLRLPFSVCRSVIPSNRSPVMVTLEPVSLDGVWATFGRFGSAAMRGSGLPGSALPGLPGRAPGLPGPPGFGDGQAVEPGRAVGVAGRLRRRAGGRGRPTASRPSRRRPGEQVPDPVQDVGDDVAVPLRAGARCRGRRRGRGAAGRRRGRVRDGRRAGGRGGSGSAAACTALGWAARPAGGEAQHQQRDCRSTRGSRNVPATPGVRPRRSPPPAGRSTGRSPRDPLGSGSASVSGRLRLRTASARTVGLGTPRLPTPRQADPPPPGPASDLSRRGASRVGQASASRRRRGSGRGPGERERAADDAEQQTDEEAAEVEPDQRVDRGDRRDDRVEQPLRRGSTRAADRRSPG